MQHTQDGPTADGPGPLQRCTEVFHWGLPFMKGAISTKTIEHTFLNYRCLSLGGVSPGAFLCISKFSIWTMCYCSAIYSRSFPLYLLAIPTPGTFFPRAFALAFRSLYLEPSSPRHMQPPPTATTKFRSLLKCSLLGEPSSDPPCLKYNLKYNTHHPSTPNPFPASCLPIALVPTSHTEHFTLLVHCLSSPFRM